jgi:hypothetical protein
MKRILTGLLLIFLFTSCTKSGVKDAPQGNTAKPVESKDVVKNENKKAEKPAVSEVIANKEKAEDGIRAISLSYTDGLNIDNILDQGFNTVILEVSGVRLPKKPYKTDFAALKKLLSSTALLESKGIDYIISVTSGPGYSKDEDIYSVLNSSQEQAYFAQMMREILSRYKTSTHLKGISADIENHDIPADSYYKMLNRMTSKILDAYVDMPVIMNLHPLSFEEDFKDMPELQPGINIINARIMLNGISYPGYGAGFDSSVKLSKNEMLKKLQNLKEFSHASHTDVIVTIKVPWGQNSDVFLQDMFELFKMMDFDYNICYGNTNDIYDFTSNEPVINVLKRHSK